MENESSEGFSDKGGHSAALSSTAAAAAADDEDDDDDELLLPSVVTRRVIDSEHSVVTSLTTAPMCFDVSARDNSLRSGMQYYIIHGSLSKIL